MIKNKLDIHKYMTQEMKEVLELQEKKAKENPNTSTQLEDIRKSYEEERKFWNEDAPELFKVVDKKIKDEEGEISFRVYYPKDKELNSCTIFIHGGGFILGSSNTHDKTIRNFSKYSGTVVVSIDYTLSPEAKFPKAIKQSASVVNFLRKNAKELKINKDFISFAGDSAGANLCLGTTLYLRDELKDISFIKSLILYYGLFGLKDSPSRRILGGSWDGLAQEDLEYYEEAYLNNKEEATHPYYDCLNADLSYSIPPVYLGVAELDPLKDDSFALEHILKKHKITCKLKVYKGMLHSFLHYSRIIPEALEAIISGTSFLKEYNKK